MTELSKKILESYQVRKSWKQKTEFIDLIQSYYPEAKDEYKRYYAKNRNIVIGDVEKAKYILTAHYDTCAILPFPNFITPCNMFIYLIYNILIAIPLIIAMMILPVITILILNVVTLPKILDLILSEASLFIGMFGVMYLFICGVSNKHTANDNTSGVIELIEIYAKMTDEMKKKTAFVFFDNEEKGLFGSMAFKAMHKDELIDKYLINFDCISDGDNILCVLYKKTMAEKDRFEKAFAKTEEKTPLIKSSKKAFYPSDQMNFEKSKSVAVCALNKNKIFGLYMDKIHTSKDIVFDERNIEYIRDSVISLIES